MECRLRFKGEEEVKEATKELEPITTQCYIGCKNPYQNVKTKKHFGSVVHAIKSVTELQQGGTAYEQWVTRT